MSKVSTATILMTASFMRAALPAETVDLDLDHVTGAPGRGTGRTVRRPAAYRC